MKINPWKNFWFESIGYGTYAAVQEGIMGAVGGGIAGGLTSKLPLSMNGFLRSTITGTASGSITGGIYGAYVGYQETGDLEGMVTGAKVGFINGAIVGTTLGAASWTVEKFSGKWPHCPNSLKEFQTRVRSQEPWLNREIGPLTIYAGKPTKEGMARHHIKPLIWGGSDVDSRNLRHIPNEVHRQRHPGTAVINAP